MSDFLNNMFGNNNKKEIALTIIKDDIDKLHGDIHYIQSELKCIKKDINNKIAWLITFFGIFISISTAYNISLINAKIESVDNKYDAKFEKIDTQFVQIDARFNNLESEIKEIKEILKSNRK